MSPLKGPKIPAVFKVSEQSAQMEQRRMAHSVSQEKKPKKIIQANKITYVKLKTVPESIAAEKAADKPFDKTMPKPPLAKQKVQKQNLVQDEISGEALLKMADEGLAQIDKQIRSLSNKRPTQNKRAPSPQNIVAENYQTLPN